MSEHETSAKSVPAKPRVFISYSHDSPEHKRRVGALANQLCVDGIDARIDQFVPDPDDGWIHWMRTQVKDSEKVLLVFTQTYQRRFEGDEEEGRGLGVTFEGAIVTQMLYKSGGHNAKFRPVVFSEEDERFIPLELQRSNCYRVDTQENYETLLRWLYNAPLNIPPRGRGQTCHQNRCITSFHQNRKRLLPLLKEVPPPGMQHCKVNLSIPSSNTIASQKMRPFWLI